jgi:hypothetical protein
LEVHTLFGFGNPKRNRFNSREYYALREAQALRLQLDAEAESFCDSKLEDAQTSSRDKRFYRLVRKALKRV